MLIVIFTCPFLNFPYTCEDHKQRKGLNIGRTYSKDRLKVIKLLDLLGHSIAAPTN